MGLLDSLLGGGSSSSATDSRVGATDQAQVTQGSAQNVQPGALAVRGNATIKTGGVDLSNSKGSVVSVTTADPEVLQSAIDAVKKVSSDTGDQIAALAAHFGDDVTSFIQASNLLAAQQSQAQQQNATDNVNALGSVVESSLSQIKDLVANQQPAGTVQINRTVLYMGLAVLALVGFIFWRKN